MLPRSLRFRGADPELLLTRATGQASPPRAFGSKEAPGQGWGRGLGPAQTRPRHRPQDFPCAAESRSRSPYTEAQSRASQLVGR